MYNSMSVTEETRDALLTFLRDPNVREFSYPEKDKYICLLLKIKYDAETDFLYLLRAYDTDNPRQIDENAEFAGIYSRTQDKVYDADYAFAKAIGETESRSAILSFVTRAVREAVIRLVGEGAVAVTDDAEPLRDNREYFLTYGASKEALECYYGRKTPEYDPSIHIDRLSTPGFVLAMNHPDEAVEDFAQRYIRRNANAINERLWQLGIVREHLASLDASPGEHTIRREIADRIDSNSMKNVSIDIDKEGKHLSCKISACALKRANDTDYSTWHLDTPGARAFESLFGRGAHLLASDISRITYARKTLYEKAEQ